MCLLLFCLDKTKSSLNTTGTLPNSFNDRRRDISLIKKPFDVIAGLIYFLGLCILD